uniref:Trehalose 6-phosphate phosphatase n=1 Tax=Aplanochytrium stocchinoi TaxID=215587 RepID=A0A7S3V3F2_9STRA|mmetsp:Transcript_17763/g.21882  ORF Transcript_17763/g.21882 Transcript_17763/m.21882 type:complete len:273 (-) Transcript_17763:147-965(-)|eukprot:CAMPEP_0204829346 /NCGR_PEP_ID=MMETSP1346-20131115/7457_1 /ASSEMBLY_ACC=CAM_ASM_000771 /TAXON_ID=215587 /ORGANISM="Aplanochytrium stocchinoi, Strain GSBS06" /LENGTH=272 /DNA_ID=CAMNT_0051959045 /DNA_START=318 /DNA_END=1136 /DNA_ORIENTATION=-
MLGPTVGSALDLFGEIEKDLAGKKPIFFLDYDGTLSPIVNVPDEAFMPDETRETVRKISKLYTCAIVSGRGLPKLKNFVKLDGLFYAGSHGMDISGPDHFESGFDIGSEYHLENISEIIGKMEADLKQIPGAWLEKSKFTFSVHYRMVAKDKVKEVEAIVDTFLKTEPGQKFQKHNGKMVFELKPKVDWNKGEALKWIMKALKVDQDPAVTPIYIGDDVTDEDAFKVLAEAHKGVSILVTKDKRTKTNAKYYVHDTLEVKSFLERFVAAGAL